MHICILKNLFKYPRYNYIPICRFTTNRNLDTTVEAKKFLKDDEILVEKVRVLKDKKLLGDYTTHEAKLIAKSQNLNLILFKSNSDPPICVIDNYKQFLKDLQEKETKKDSASYSFDPSLKSKTVQISENCATADLDRKLSSIRNFLLSGQRVEIVIFTKSKRSKEPNKRAHSSGLSSTSQNTINELSAAADSKGMKVSYDSDNSLLQRIDYIYSRLTDISRPHTLKNKINVNSRQIMLKFWPK